MEQRRCTDFVLQTTPSAALSKPSRLGWRVPGNLVRGDLGRGPLGLSTDKELIQSRIYLFRTLLANNLRTNPEQTSSSLSARMLSCHRKIVSWMERSRRSGIGERNNPRSRAHRKFQTSHEIVEAISPRRKAAINCAISCSSTKSSK